MTDSAFQSLREGMRDGFGLGLSILIVFLFVALGFVALMHSFEVFGLLGVLG